VASDKEVTTANQQVFISVTFGDFLGRRYVAFLMRLPSYSFASAYIYSRQKGPACSGLFELGNFFLPFLSSTNGGAQV
jgi:hypothetical protein